MDEQPAILGSQNPSTRYERLLPLGMGGMATVHLALAVGQSGFNRLVVLKCVREGLPEGPQMRQMFVNEARLTACLNHPNIVQAFEIIETEDAMVLVMEYLDGLSLTDAYRAARHELSLPMRLRIVSEVLTGLHYAHDRTDYQGEPLGIVHRDVTPTNVFVTYDGRVKLLDFGIAKMTAAEDRTRSGLVKGKLAYMPPEQLAGRNIDRRSDIYAVGCLLWEAVAGSRMWERRTDADIARSVLTGKIPALSSRVTVDTALEQIVTRATAADPDQRYPTAAALRDDLEQFMATLPAVTARDVGQMLAAVCADARADRQKKIAQAIRAVEANLERENAQTSERPVTSEAPLGPAEGNSSVPSPATLVSPKPRDLRLLIFPVIVLAGALGWATFRHLSGAGAERSAAPATSSPVLPKLTVQAMPSAARVFIDGARIAGVPASVEVSPATPHTIRVELEGHRTSERRMRVDADTLVTIDLIPTTALVEPPPAEPSSAPAVPSVNAAKREAVRPARRPASGSRVPRAEDNCNPPYFFSGGIKTYKPECL